MRSRRVLAGAARYVATGAYGVPGLHAPSDFRVLADQAERRCAASSSQTLVPTLCSQLYSTDRVDALVADLERGAFRGEEAVEALDDVSDTVRARETQGTALPASLTPRSARVAQVCSVVDVAELCRNTHTLQEWNHAAEAACVRLHAVVSDLNGRGGLYSALCAAQQACAEGKEPPLSPEAAHVAASLRAEFERGGVHLPAEARDALQSAQAQAVSAGHALSRMLGDPASSNALAATSATGQDKGVSAAAGQSRGRAARGSHASDEAPLLTLLRARARIAQLLGFTSYAALATAPLFARIPEAPARFCAQLAKALDGPVRDELARTSGSEARIRHAHLPASAMRASASIQTDKRAAAQLFSVNATVDGLCTLTQRLFGVTFTDEPLAHGEAWAPGVRKLRASHAEEGLLGWVYLDLVPRPHKLPGAAHFVIRAGRTRGEGVPPRVALVANLGGSDASACGLPHSSVVLLHHEWGHALHSLLSRTRYQHLSGTRGPVDCVEAPSTLMERFAWSQGAVDAWPAFARTPFPQDLLHRLRASRHNSAATDALAQVVQSSADLALHSARSPDVVDSRFVTASLEEAASQHGVLLSGRGSQSMTIAMSGLGHVVGYGAVYYSYLYGAALSGSAWRLLSLDAEPLSSSAGHKLWRHLLRPGGTAPPAESLTSLLGPNALSSLADTGQPDAPNVEHAVRDILST